jgi:uncharacterized protein (UPF0303 family)
MDENTRVLSNKNYPITIDYMFEGKRVFYDLYIASKYDKTVFTPKKNTTLFRVHSNKIEMPIVCINTERSLVYFLVDYDRENSIWETRGIKLSYPLVIA